MRRTLMIVTALLAALVLFFATACRKTLRDTPEEQEPNPAPGPPPAPGAR